MTNPMTNPTTKQTELVKTTEQALIAKPDYGFDVARVVAMRAATEEVVEKVLREGEHYGVIPGTTQEGKKPKKVLLLPGAEVLCQVFRLRPEFLEMAVIERDDFIYYKVKCRLFHSVTGECVGEALGSANTREEKYTAQTAAKLCPVCGKPTIFKSKKRQGDSSTTEPGWFCWVKKGGCGAEFSADDKKLLDQTGAVSTDKVWNLHHTILSQAQKRPYVRAVRNATGTSNLFTDEDVPPDDDDHGDGQQQRGQHPQVASKDPAADPGAIRDLNADLTSAGIRGKPDPALSKPEQEEADRAARFRWVNLWLKQRGEPEVASWMKLTAAQVRALRELAAKAELPNGW